MGTPRSIAAWMRAVVEKVFSGFAGGSRTLSITWMTPFEHSISAFTTFASPMRKPIDTGLPSRVLALDAPSRSPDRTVPGTTW